jgi:dihydroorotate dehydrogenase
VIDRLYALSKPVFFRLDPESVHNRTIATLGRISQSDTALNLLRKSRLPDDPRLAVSVNGLDLPGPIGIAAGLDKNGVAHPALHALGWDFVEVGTITVRPQPGNPTPRIFRLPQDNALINRMGFPGDGADRIAINLVNRRKRRSPIGCNVGPNKESVQTGMDAVVADCTELVRRFASLARYLVINVSSPNTASLRDLQGADALRALLTEVKAAVPASAPAEIDSITGVVLDTGISGIIATNTTIARPAHLEGAARDELGGLSGDPLRLVSLGVVRQITSSTNGSLPVIAAGGISSAAHAIDAFAAGAVAIQIYTGMIYQGPRLAATIKHGLIEHLDRTGASSLADLSDLP